MQYRKESIFNKYNVAPNIEQSKLLNVFQKNPKIRKDLPKVISIIKDKDKLFEEELFTLKNKENLTPLELNHYNLLNNLLNINVLDINSLKQFEQSYIKFRNNNYNYFFYNKDFDIDKTNQYIDKFINSLFKELLNIIINNVDKIEGNTIVWILKFYQLNNKELLAEFEEHIASKIEVSLSKINDIEYLNENLNFICNLPEVFFQKDTIYTSYLYFVDKTFIKHEDITFINENYIKVFTKLKQEDAVKQSKILNLIGNYLTDLPESMKLSYDVFKNNVDKLVSNYLYYACNIKTTESKLDEKEMKKNIEILHVLYDNNAQYYQKLYSLINNLINQKKKTITANEIYELVQHIVKGGFHERTYEKLSNILIRITPFLEDVAEWSNNRNSLFNFIKINYGRTQYVFYTSEYIKTLEKFGCRLNKTIFIDEMLCKCYFLHHMQPDILDNSRIENIKMSVLDPLGLLDTADEYAMISAINPISGGITYKGMFISDVLNDCPGDWSFDGMTIDYFLKYKLGHNLGSIYGTSKFSIYQEKYDKLFKNRKSYYLKNTSAILEKVDSVTKAQDIYIKAQELYNQNKYQEALSEFNKIDYYKNSGEYIKIIKDIICEETYQQGLIKYQSEEYSEAIHIFEGIKEYKNSLDFIDSCLNWIKEKQYQKGINLFKNEQYEEALIEFKNIQYYKNVKEYIEVTSNMINEKKYQKGVELFNNKQYQEAITVFEEIAEYKNSTEFINIAIEIIKEEKYRKAIDLYNKNELSKSLKIFKTLQDYKDANEWTKRVSTEYKQRLTYQKAMILFEDKKYKKAKEEFLKISNYKDSNQYIEICQNRIIIKTVLIIIVIILSIIFFAYYK